MAEVEVGHVFVLALDALDGIGQVLDGFAVLLLREAHLAHAHGGGGAGLEAVEVLGGREEEGLVGAALAHHDGGDLLQQVDVFRVGFELLAVDFHQLVAGGVGREGGLDAGDIAADGAGLDAVVDVLLQLVFEAFAGEVVVVDHQGGLGLAGADVVDGGFHVLDDVGGIQFAFHLGGLVVEGVVALDAFFLEQQLDVHGLHGGHLGGFAVVGDAGVVHAHQLVDVLVAFLLGLGGGDFHLHDVGAVGVEVLALVGALGYDFGPELVGVVEVACVLCGLELLDVFLIERHGLEHGLLVDAFGAAPAGGYLLGGGGHRSGGQEESQGQFLDCFHLCILFLFSLWFSISCLRFIATG